MELLGVFRTVHEAAAAVDALLAGGVEEADITSLTSVPYPEGVLVTDSGRIRLHRATLACGAGGALLGLLLAVGTAWLYPLQTGDKPIISLFPTGIIAYECAMLFALIGTLAGMLLEMKLPATGRRLYDPGIADGLIGIAVTVAGVRAEEAEDALRRSGALRILSSEEQE